MVERVYRDLSACLWSFGAACVRTLQRCPTPWRRTSHPPIGSPRPPPSPIPLSRWHVRPAIPLLIRLEDVAAFVVAQLLGAATATALFRWLLPPPKPSPRRVLCVARQRVEPLQGGLAYGERFPPSPCWRLAARWIQPSGNHPYTCARTEHEESRLQRAAALGDKPDDRSYGKAKTRTGAYQRGDHRHLARANTGKLEGEHFQHRRDNPDDAHTRKKHSEEPRSRRIRQQDAKEHITERGHPEEERAALDSPSSTPPRSAQGISP